MAPFNADNYISNISYINKDFQSIWDDILTTVPLLTSKWVPSDANESDPLAVLLKLLAVIADKLNYNIDKNILELFPATLTQERSAYNVYESLGYAPRGYKSATTNVLFSYTAPEGDTGATFSIPQFTSITDADSTVVFTTLKESELFNTSGGKQQISVSAMEGTINDLKINAERSTINLQDLDAQYRLYFPQRNIAENGVFVSNNPGLFTTSALGGNEWRRVDNLAQYVSGEKVFKLGLDVVTGSVYIQFPQDIGALIAEGLYIKYIISSGELGNISRNTLNKFLNSSIEFATNLTGTSVPGAGIIINNSIAALNGADPETIQEMKTSFEAQVGVFDTLVALRDYVNYIYNYEKEDGSNIVSNIVVTDRLNDMYETVKYKQRTVNNTSIDKIESNIPTSSSYLRCYPLPAVASVDSKDTFDATFKQDASLHSVIEAAIESAKSVLVSLSTQGSPILVPYNLTGNIYLNQKVSNVDAITIAGKIQQALYKALNARKMTFGQEVNYSSVVDTIVNADSRIQYAAIDPIEYENPNLSSFTGYTNANYPNVKIRNVLAGNAAWTTYDPFTYDYNDGISAIYSGIKTINPYVTGPTDATSLTVGKNETVSILTPKLDVATSYTSYLYVVANIGSTAEISANKPYTLETGDTIYIYETRDAAEDNIEAARIGQLKVGDIIQSTITIKTTDTETKEYLTLSAADSINVLNRAGGTISSSTSQPVFIATNSAGLATALGATNPAPYILRTGEYLLATDDKEASNQLIILGEGTEIDANEAISIEPISIDQSILNGQIGNVTFTQIDSGVISYNIYDINTFAEGYTLQAKQGDTLSTILENYTDDAAKAHTIVNVADSDRIIYSKNDEEPRAIVTLDGAIKLSWRLSLDLTNTRNTQELYAADKSQTGTQYIGLTFDPEATPPEPDITINGSEGGKAIQATSKIISPGGAIIINNEVESLQIRAFEAGASLSASGGFILMPDEGVTIPGAGTDYFIFPYYAAGDTACKYYLAKGEMVITAAKITAEDKDVYIGAPVKVAAEATYINYLGASAYVSGISQGKLSADYIYFDDFDCLYKPETDVSIANPLLGRSYFYEQHPLNMFSLPMLADINITIDNASKIK